jgi:TonB family protein
LPVAKATSKQDAAVVQPSAPSLRAERPVEAAPHMPDPPPIAAGSPGEPSAAVLAAPSPTPDIAIRSNASNPEIDTPASPDAADVAQEAERLQAAQLEEQRQVIAREEAARLEAERQEAERQEAERLAAAQLEAQRQEAARAEEATRVEAARRDAERLEIERRETESREAERKETERRETERREMEPQEAERKTTERQEAERQEAERQATERREDERREAERQETERQNAERREAQRQEAQRQEAQRQEAQRQEAQRQETERQNAERREAERRETERLAAAQADAKRQEVAQPKAAPQEVAAPRGNEEEEQREAKLRAIGRQLDEEAARRDASTPTRSPNTLPLSLSTGRRVKLWGRAHPNAQLIRYSEAWEQKIQMNTTVDTARRVANQLRSSPTVTVAIRSDGSVESVVFELSSGVPEVDEAIRRIVRSMEHYNAFPPELARDYDVIEIRRTWHFDMAVRLY